MYSLRTLLSTLLVLLTINTIAAQAPASLPRTIASGPFDAGHIQGIAVDAEHKYIYYSYTTMLIKTDFEGRIIGSVTGLLGHLGDLDFNAEDGRGIAKEADGKVGVSRLVIAVFLRSDAKLCRHLLYADLIDLAKIGQAIADFLKLCIHGGVLLYQSL